MEGGETLLCLVRHGETEWNAAGRLQGRTDVPLSGRGRIQARAVARELVRRAGNCARPWVAVYTSPLRRALDTARCIGEALDLDPVVRLGLVERSFGILEGRTWEELARDFPDWRERPWQVPGLEGESELRSRAAGALLAIAEAHRGGRVVVVSHGAFLNAFLFIASGGDVGSGKTRLENGAISVVVRQEGLWRVEEVNRTEHLSSDGE